MSKNGKIVATAVLWIVALLVSVVGPAWLTEDTARQTVSWGAYVVAAALTAILWMRPTASHSRP